MELLQGKWTVVLLARLKQGAMRYGELRACIPISDKMLTQRLRELQERDLVGKGADGRYGLTPRADAFRGVLESLYRWGEEEAERRGIVFPSAEATNDLVR